MTTQPTTAPGSSPLRRLAVWLYPRRRLQLGALLLLPLAGLVIAYFGALFILLLAITFVQMRLLRANESDTN